MSSQNVMEISEIKNSEPSTADKKVVRLNISQFELTKILYSSGMLSKIDLTASAKLFLWALCSHYNPNNETMFPSQQTVAQKLGISEKSAQRAVKELKMHGLIDYETKRVNHYTFGAKFFELVKMSGAVGQNVLSEEGQNVRLTNKNEKNKEHANFSFKSFGRGVKWRKNNDSEELKVRKMVPSVEETRKMIEEHEKIRDLAFNPYEYNREDALQWLKATPQFWLLKSDLANFLVNKYKFKDFLYILKDKMDTAPENFLLKNLGENPGEQRVTGT